MRSSSRAHAPWRSSARLGVGSCLGVIFTLCSCACVSWAVPVHLFENPAAMTVVRPFAWLIGLIWAGGDVRQADSYLQQEAAIVTYFLGSVLLTVLVGALSGASIAAVTRDPDDGAALR